jgi:WD40 repeat protein
MIPASGGRQPAESACLTFRTPIAALIRLFLPAGAAQFRNSATRTFGILATAFAAVLRPGVANSGETDPPITAIAFAPDGKSVIVGSQSGIHVLSWPALHRERSLETELRHVHDLAFSPNGEGLAAAGGTPGERGTVELFTWPDIEFAWRSTSPTDLVYSIDWHPDEATLAIGGLDHTCRIRNAELGNDIEVLEGHSRGILAVCILEDGKTLVTGGLDQSLRVWDVSFGETKLTRNNHTGAVVAIVERPSADPAALPMIASVGEDRTVRFWQPTIGRLVRWAKLPSAGLDAAWSPDGAALYVSCRDGHLRRIDPDTVEVLEDRPVLDGWAYTLAVHPEGRQILVGGQGGNLKAVDIAGP